MTNVDELVAIIVVAVFYAAGLGWAPPTAAIALLGLFDLLQTGRGTGWPLLLRQKRAKGVSQLVVLASGGSRA